MVDGIFAFSPDPLPPDLDATHNLLTENGDAMYAVGQLSDLDTWLDSPEVILSPLIHREAVYRYVGSNLIPHCEFRFESFGISCCIIECACIGHRNHVGALRRASASQATSNAFNQHCGRVRFYVG